jgi:hypothetical protein
MTDECISWSDIIGRLPFSFHPLLIFSYLTDALFRSFRTHCSNLPAPIVVDYGGYFGGASDMLICGKSTPIRSIEEELLKTADLVTPFDFRYLTGIEYTMNTI